MSLSPPTPPASEAGNDWKHQRERSSPAILKLMVWISLTFGRSISRLVLHGIAAYFTLFAPRARRASRAYLQRALGRHADLINIAGKRTSLAYLNHQINAIPGVVDAAFHLPDGDESETPRLTAFVVAPALERQQLLAALRQRIDPIFLPRPLILLDTLPRNSTGKLPREALQALCAKRRQHD